MPLTAYLKIPDIDGESYADLLERSTLDLSQNELNLLEGLVREGYTFSASMIDFEQIKIKWDYFHDQGDEEYTGPEITPIGPVSPGGGQPDPFGGQFGADDHLAFLKFDGLNDEERDDLAVLLTEYLGDDFHLITAGDKTFLKLTIDPETPNDHFPPDPALTDLSDDLFG